MSQKAPFISSLSLPAVAAPMFLVSGPQLVIEACKSGIVGTFPALNQRSSEGFEQWLIEINQALAEHEQQTGQKPAPYGVNLIVHQTNPRVQADLALCIKHRVPLIITSLGAVSELVDAVHSYGGLVFHDVIKKRHAEKAAEAGVDGLVLVCAGAGGHAGTFSPFSFLHEVRQFFDKTILLAGSISTGRDIAAAVTMGADLAYLGTRFINTQESRADERYKQMIVSSSAQDIVYTAAISGVHGNFLKASLEAAGITEALWASQNKIDFGKELDSEAKAWATIWSAGHGVSAIQDSPPVAELVSQMKTEFEQALQQQASRYLTLS